MSSFMGLPCFQGLLVNDDKAAEDLNAAERQASHSRAGGGAARGGGFRWVAKWKHFAAQAVVPGNDLIAGASHAQGAGRAGGCQQLILLLVPNGMQAQLGSLTCRVVSDPTPPAGSGRAGASSSSPRKEQATLKGWFTGAAPGQNAARENGAPGLGKLQKSGGKRSDQKRGCDSLFEPTAITEETLRSLRTYRKSGERGRFNTGQDDDAILEAALAASRAAGEGEMDEASMLARALEVSRADAGAKEEDRLMKEALEASVRDARRAEEEETVLMVYDVYVCTEHDDDAMTLRYFCRAMSAEEKNEEVEEERCIYFDDTKALQIERLRPFSACAGSPCSESGICKWVETRVEWGPRKKVYRKRRCSQDRCGSGRDIR